MPWQILDSERTYLRELAKKQAEYAALPIMEARKKMWYDLNDATPGARPPVIIETWTFNPDFMPAGVTRCTSPDARGIEWQLLCNIRNHELMDDDKVMPDTYNMGWFCSIDEMGVKLGRHTARDGEGRDIGFQFEHPIKDLKEDFHLLKPAVCSVDKATTLAYKAWLEELFGDILPVRIATGTFGATMLTERLIELMGMEAYFMAMLEDPDQVHRYMAFLRDNALRVMHWAEAEGLLRLNNGNDTSFGSSYNFTRRLPAAGYKGEAARLCDMWGASNSQESVGISPELYHEFCFPYYRDVCKPMGLLYYGCCEPVHPFWEDVKNYPHLKKVSVPQWCDQKMISETLRGTEIVYSRKPNPNLIGVDPALDEEAWKAHIRETLDLTRGVFLEIIIRDVYTVHGNLNKPRRAVELARAEVDRHVGA